MKKVTDPFKMQVKKVRVFTAFSGMDAQCQALDRVKARHPYFDYELIGWSEFDPESNKPINEQPAVIAHNAIYPQWADRNYGDISKIDWSKVPDFDLFTYSFPCTDISLAGAMKGFKEGSGTRSSLLWECRKAIKAKKPKVLILENVKTLINGSNFPEFKRWLDELQSYGYRNFWKVLDSQDYGVAQHRQRVFCVSILDDSAVYSFPKKREGVTPKISDILESHADKKYYLKKMPDNFPLIREDEDFIKVDNKIVRPLNPMPDGNCRTIKAQYQQTSIANMLRPTGGFAATGVIEYEDKETK